MNTNPLISVIVPVFNTEKYLSECVESLLHQTYTNIEIILVDDGSTDNSGAICDEFAARHSNIKVVHKENAGLGMARNTGLQQVTSEYVTFLDSDDYLDVCLIEKLYNAIVKNGVDVAKAGFKRFVGKGNVILVKGYEEEVFSGQKAKTEFAPRMIGSSPEKKDSLEMCVCAALYRMQPIWEYHLEFPSEREMISEDLCFNIEYAQHANGACTIEESGYFYRETEGSLSRRYRADRFEKICSFYFAMQDKLKQLQYDDQTMYRLDRMLFINARICISHLSKTPELSASATIKEIRKICRHKAVANAINRYPIAKLPIRQKVFVKLLQYQFAAVLFGLAKVNLC